MELFYYEKDDNGLAWADIRRGVLASLEDRKPSRVLVVAPDFTRFYSGAGQIANMYYHILEERGCRMDLLIALGTHEMMSREQAAQMYGDIPYERFLRHDFRSDVVKLGEVPSDLISEWSEGSFSESIDVEINRSLLDESYDLILSIGQVVPHEVVGMASYTKNLFVGVGGASMINKSHMLGAAYGLERIMGRDQTPVRRLFDYSFEQFLSQRPVRFVQTVCTADDSGLHVHGLFIGDSRKVFEAAVGLAQKKNVHYTGSEIHKCIAWLDPEEFQSTWLGNKAVYRTRMAIEDGGELIILAPGVRHFGEDAAIDGLIRKYGYRGREYILKAMSLEENQDLRENMSAAAHLIHGSSDGRFSITYAVRDISQEEIRSVGYQAASYEETVQKYDPKTLKPGINRLADGEEIYFIPNPALGLWMQ